MTDGKVGRLQEQLERTGQGVEGRKELPGEGKSAGLSFTKTPAARMGLAAWHNILVEVNLQPPHETVGAPSPSLAQTQPCRASAN